MIRIFAKEPLLCSFGLRSMNIRFCESVVRLVSALEYSSDQTRKLCLCQSLYQKPVLLTDLVAIRRWTCEILCMPLVLAASLLSSWLGRHNLDQPAPRSTHSINTRTPAHCGDWVRWVELRRGLSGCWRVAHRGPRLAGDRPVKGRINRPDFIYIHDHDAANAFLYCIYRGLHLLLYTLVFQGILSCDTDCNELRDTNRRIISEGGLRPPKCFELICICIDWSFSVKLFLFCFRPGALN